MRARYNETVLGTCSFQAESNQLCRTAGSLVSCFPVTDPNLWLINSDLPSSSSIISWGCRDTQTRDYFRSPVAVEVPGLLEIPTFSRENQFSVIWSPKHSRGQHHHSGMSSIVTGLSEIGDIFRIFFFFFWWGRKRQKFHKTVLSFTNKYSGHCYSSLFYSVQFNFYNTLNCCRSRSNS